MNLSDLKRNAYMLRGSDAKRGYMRWWHSFQGVCPTTQETRTFFVEYSILNPALGTTQPILGQHPYYKRHGMKPSYVCIKAGVFPKNGDGGLQLQSYYPMTSLQVAQDPFYMQIEEKYKKDYALSLELVRKERSRFMEALKEVPGLRVFPSQANYIMAELTDGTTASELTCRLLNSYSLFIKDLSSKTGLNGRQLVRIAVRSEEDNNRLTEALREALK